MSGTSTRIDELRLLIQKELLQAQSKLSEHGLDLFPMRVITKKLSQIDTLQAIIDGIDIFEKVQSINQYLKNILWEITSGTSIFASNSWEELITSIFEKEKKMFSFCFESYTIPYPDVIEIFESLVTGVKQNLIEIKSFLTSYPKLKAPELLKCTRRDFENLILSEIPSFIAKNQTSNNYSEFSFALTYEKDLWIIKGKNNPRGYLTYFEMRKAFEGFTLENAEIPSIDELKTRILKFINDTLTLPKHITPPPKPVSTTSPIEFKLGQKVVVWQSLTKHFDAIIRGKTGNYYSCEGEGKRGRIGIWKVKPEYITSSVSTPPSCYSKISTFTFEPSGITTEEQLHQLLVETRNAILPVVKSLFSTNHFSTMDNVKIQWGDRMTYSNCGWYKPSANLIQISKSLKNTPAFVIKGVIWHELLHIKYQGSQAHCSEFRRYERMYPDLSKKLEFIRSYYTKLRYS